MTETIRLRMSSMQHTDTPRQIQEDARDAIPNATKAAPDFIGFTELAGPVLTAVRERCKDAGYDLIRKGSVGIAVHPRQDLLESGSVDVLTSFKSPSGRGSYRARPILEVTTRTPGGTKATVHIAHWITDAPTQQREDKRTEQSEKMADRVRLHSRGDRVGFWMGDTNEDEGKPEREVQRVLTRNNLLSIYDELDTYPNTHGQKTIDVVGRYKGDRRVKAKRVRRRKKRNSDHRVVDATYEIG